MINNGHAAQLTLTASDKISDQVPKVSGTGMDGDTFQFNQLHFHWHATDDRQGSEHAIDGHRTALEMHMVHFNTKYGDMATAASKEDGLAVLGVLFDVEERDNPGLKFLTDRLPAITKEGVATNITQPVRLAKLLPKDFEVFYRYRGSLTTPPCSESVNWIVFPDVLKVRQNQAMNAYIVIVT